jgi:hypothetical protein
MQEHDGWEDCTDLRRRLLIKRADLRAQMERLSDRGRVVVMSLLLADIEYCLSQMEPYDPTRGGPTT